MERVQEYKAFCVYDKDGMWYDYQAVLQRDFNVNLFFHKNICSNRRLGWSIPVVREFHGGSSENSQQIFNFIRAVKGKAADAYECVAVMFFYAAKRRRY